METIQSVPRFVWVFCFLSKGIVLSPRLECSGMAVAHCSFDLPPQLPK